MPFPRVESGRVNQVQFIEFLFDKWFMVNKYVRTVPKNCYQSWESFRVIRTELDRQHRHEVVSQKIM